MDLWRLSLITTAFVNVVTLPRASPAAVSRCYKNWSTKLSITHKTPAPLFAKARKSRTTLKSLMTPAHVELRQTQLYLLQVVCSDE